MVGAIPWTSPARVPRGGITWVSALLIVLLVGGGYLAWTWAPVYVLHAEVKQVVRNYMNQAVKERDDAVLVEAMVHKLRLLDEQVVLNEQGKPITVPTVQVAPADVSWERDPSADPPALHVAFSYTRDVPYPLLGRSTQKTLSIDLTGDLKVPDWGPSR